MISGLTAGLLLALLLALYAFSERESARNQEKQSRQLLYVANVNLAQKAHSDGNVRLTHDLLDALRPKPGESNTAARGFECPTARSLLRPVTTTPSACGVSKIEESWPFSAAMTAA